MEQDCHTHDACQLIKRCSKDLIRVFRETKDHAVFFYFWDQFIHYCIKYLIDLFEYIKQHRSLENSSQFIECSSKYLIDLLRCIEHHRPLGDFETRSIKCCSNDLINLLDCMKKYPASFCSEQLIECCIKELTDSFNQMKQHQCYQDPDKLIECYIQKLLTETDIRNQMKCYGSCYDSCGFINDCNNLADSFKHNKHQLFSDYPSGTGRALNDMIESLRCKANALYSDYLYRRTYADNNRSALVQCIDQYLSSGIKDNREELIRKFERIKENSYSNYPYETIICWMQCSIDFLQKMKSRFFSDRSDELIKCSIKYLTDLLWDRKQRSFSNDSDPFIKCCIEDMLHTLSFIEQHLLSHYQCELTKCPLERLIRLLEHKEQNLSSGDRDELTKCPLERLIRLLEHKKQNLSSGDRDELTKFWIGQLTNLLNQMKQHQSYHNIHTLISDSIQYLEKLLHRIEPDRNSVCMTPANLNDNPKIWSSTNIELDDLLLRDPRWKPTQSDYALAMVYYYFDENLPKKHRDMVVEATKDIETAAPGIHFEEKKDAPNRIRIFQGTISRSRVGMIGGEQMLEVAIGAIKADIIHEFMHALGFLHEHQRHDRDQYVSCYSKDEVNYGMRGIIFGPYDPDSIMHYEDDPRELETKNSPRPDKRVRLSSCDKIALNMIYPPARRPDFYEPRKDSAGSYYCERRVIEHNQASIGSWANIFQEVREELSHSSSSYSVIAGWNWLLLLVKNFSENPNDLCGPEKYPKCFSCQLYGVDPQTLSKWRREFIKRKVKRD